MLKVEHVADLMFCCPLLVPHAARQEALDMYKQRAGQLLFNDIQVIFEPLQMSECVGQRRSVKRR